MTNEEKEVLHALILLFKREEPSVRHSFNGDVVDNTSEWIANALEKTTLKIDKKSWFSHITWNHYSEYYILYVGNEEDKNLLEEQKDVIFEACKRIFVPNETYDLVDVEIEFNLFDGEQLEKAPDVSFGEIEKRIIHEIEKAEVCIYVAMAWFTNKRLLEKLNEKVACGLDVIVILDYNDTNTNFFSTNKYDFNLIYADLKTYFDNIVHHKFCIIDLETVVHGTYNWTNKANYNRETCTVDPNRINAKKFAAEFVDIRLKHVV